MAYFNSIEIYEYPRIENIEYLYNYKEKYRLTKPQLRLITGGADNTIGTGNWLKDMQVGTVFFAQNNVDSKDFNLILFRLEGKDGPNNEVVCLKNPRLPQEIYVDPNRFVRLYRLHYTYGVMLLPQETVEEDGHRNTVSGTSEKETMEGPDRTKEVPPTV